MMGLEHIIKACLTADWLNRPTIEEICNLYEQELKPIDNIIQIVEENEKPIDNIIQIVEENDYITPVVEENLIEFDCKTINNEDILLKDINIENDKYYAMYKDHRLPTLKCVNNHEMF